MGPKPVRQRYSGVIRVQDVRATEIDKVGAPAAAVSLLLPGCRPPPCCHPRCHSSPSLQPSPNCCCSCAFHLPAPCSPQVQVQASFRPGDVVRAEVLSLGDARSYHLTTAKNELGVVYAKSVAGGRVPVHDVGVRQGGHMGAWLARNSQLLPSCCCCRWLAVPVCPALLTTCEPALCACPACCRRAHGACELAGDAVPHHQGS